MGTEVDTSGARKRTRVAVVFTADPEDPDVWSGVPSGIIRGLRAAAVEVTGVAAALPPRADRVATAALAVPLAVRAPPAEGRGRLRNAYSAAQISSALATARGATASRALRRAGALDGVVQIGTGYRLATSAPVVTFEDMTIRQAVRFPYAHWAALPGRDVQRRIALQERVYAAATAICMTSSWSAASVLADYGQAAARVHVVGMGANAPITGTPKPWDAPRFLFVGREWERKNGPALLRAFRSLRVDHPDAELHLVGGHPPVDEPGVVGHGALRLGDPAERARTLELFQRATCFVMVSRLEPSAIAYAEAIAAGLPVIGTTEGGSGDLIGDAGVLADPGSDGATLAALRMMAEPRAAAEYAERARRRAPVLTWEAVGLRLLHALGLGPEGPPLVGAPTRVVSASG